MAHKPNERFVGAWLDPAEIEKIDALANVMKLSRSAVLRQLLDLAAGRIKPHQTTNGHTSQPEAARSPWRAQGAPGTP